MKDVTVIIPNYNGTGFLPGVLDSLEKQDCDDFEVLLVDNGSSDKSVDLVKERYPGTGILRLTGNFGFSGAVNRGILASKTPYVLLLNNDTQTEPSFVRELLEGIRRHENAFSCQARMMQFYNRELLDDAGNLYCALGWAFARGKGKKAESYDREEKIFSTCAGAAIYRRDLLLQLGCFDEEHFAYLEDLDVGYRARICGYENWYIPSAVVYHIGSGTTGSRYNQFKVRYSSRNNIYMICKNMPFLQLLLNLPFLAAGFLIKILFFTARGFGREYLAGIKNGCSISRKHRKVKFRWKNLPNYLSIQLELWVNMVKRF